MISTTKFLRQVLDSYDAGLLTEEGVEDIVSEVSLKRVFKSLKQGKSFFVFKPGSLIEVNTTLDGFQIKNVES